MLSKVTHSVDAVSCPDMTSAVDWALKANNCLSFYRMLSTVTHTQVRWMLSTVRHTQVWWILSLSTVTHTHFWWMLSTVTHSIPTLDVCVCHRERVWTSPRHIPCAFYHLAIKDSLYPCCILVVTRTVNAWYLKYLPWQMYANTMRDSRETNM